jgi:DNA-binding response OmpR family regulator
MKAYLIAPADDEATILRLLLQKGGFLVQTASSMTNLTSTWPEDPLDLIVISLNEVDENLPGEIRRLRQFFAVPFLMIVDPVSENDIVAYLDAGIDLLVSRPFGIRGLQAQIRALMRRTKGTSLFHQPNLTQLDVTLDPSERTVIVANREPARLTHLEFRLLHTLITNPGQIIPAENLVEYVWGYSGEGNRDLIRGLVQRLRTKMEPDPHNPRYIINAPGIGYSFQVDSWYQKIAFTNIIARDFYTGWLFSTELALFLDMTCTATVYSKDIDSIQD